LPDRNIVIVISPKVNTGSEVSRNKITNVRLNSAIGYIKPKDMLAGRQQEIHADRDRKLEAARQHRQIRRQSAA
jgi:putative transposase